MDIHRFVLDSVPTLTELSQKVSQVYSLPDELVFMYMDPESDLITIGTNEELSLAFTGDEQNKKLTVFFRQAKPEAEGEGEGESEGEAEADREAGKEAVNVVESAAPETSATSDTQTKAATNSRPRFPDPRFMRHHWMYAYFMNKPQFRHLPFQHFLHSFSGQPAPSTEHPPAPWQEAASAMQHMAHKFGAPFFQNFAPFWHGHHGHHGHHHGPSHSGSPHPPPPPHSASNSHSRSPSHSHSPSPHPHPPRGRGGFGPRGRGRGIPPFGPFGRGRGHGPHGAPPAEMAAGAANAVSSEAMQVIEALRRQVESGAPLPQGPKGAEEGQPRAPWMKHRHHHPFHPPPFPPRMWGPPGHRHHHGHPPFGEGWNQPPPPTAFPAEPQPAMPPQPPMMEPRGHKHHPHRHSHSRRDHPHGHSHKHQWGYYPYGYGY